MESAVKPPIVPIPFVSIAAWILPGAGYFLIHQRTRGFIILFSILALFAMGVVIGGIRVVDAPSEVSSNALLQKPWFMGQILTGPVCIASAMWANRIDSSHVSHAHSWELGTLYTAIAGMLNLLAIIDSSYRAAMAEVF